MSIHIEDSLGELVSENPSLAPLFENLGFDFCCGGSQRLGEAAVERGLDPRTVVTLLEKMKTLTPQSLVSTETENPADWDTPRLIDYIVERHHRYVRKELPRMISLVEKVVHAHGPTHPSLPELKPIVLGLEKELNAHLDEEENKLFPLLKEAAKAGDAKKELVASLEDDHREVGALLSRIKTLLDEYKIPQWACATYRAMIDCVRSFEEDLHLHVHWENNVLFRR